MKRSEEEEFCSQKPSIDLSSPAYLSAASPPPRFASPKNYMPVETIAPVQILPIRVDYLI